MNEQIIERNYERGLWNKQMVRTAVKKGVLTKEAYERIVGEAYDSTGTLNDH